MQPSLRQDLKLDTFHEIRKVFSVRYANNNSPNLKYIFTRLRLGTVCPTVDIISELVKYLNFFYKKDPIRLVKFAGRLCVIGQNRRRLGRKLGRLYVCDLCVAGCGKKCDSEM